MKTAFALFLTVSTLVAGHMPPDAPTPGEDRRQLGTETAQVYPPGQEPGAPLDPQAPPPGSLG